MKLVQLNLNEMKSEEEVHSYLMEQLELPDFYGRNLDALYDMLTGWMCDNVCLEITPCEDENSPLYAFAGRLVRMLEDGAQTLEERDGKVYAVFADVFPLESERQDW